MPFPGFNAVRSHRFRYNRQDSRLESITSFRAYYSPQGNYIRENFYLESESRLNIPDSALMGGAPVMMAAPTGDAAVVEEGSPLLLFPCIGSIIWEKEPEKTIFTVKMTKFDDKKKIAVIKEVRAIFGLGLKEVPPWFWEISTPEISDCCRFKLCRSLVEIKLNVSITNDRVSFLQDWNYQCNFCGIEITHGNVWMKNQKCLFDPFEPWGEGTSREHALHVGRWYTEGRRGRLDWETRCRWRRGCARVIPYTYASNTLWLMIYSWFHWPKCGNELEGGYDGGNRGVHGHRWHTAAHARLRATYVTNTRVRANKNFHFPDSYFKINKKFLKKNVDFHFQNENF